MRRRGQKKRNEERRMKEGRREDGKGGIERTGEGNMS